MAIYHLSVKTISRSSGRSATGAAAYRSGEKITDQRTGEIHDYTRKRGVISATLVLPANAPAWAADRDALWNAAEQAETRKNSTVAREFEVALPAELSPAERQRLSHDFARELVERHGCAADVAIHTPGKEGDNRNHHAHILLSTRRLVGEGFGEKTRELDAQKTGSALVTAWRERFAELTNERLQENGSDSRVDHRTLEAQGIDREPTLHLGPTATAIERRTGEASSKRQDYEQAAADRQRQVADQVAATQRTEWERMSSTELAAEITRLKPPSVVDQVKSDRAVLEARRETFQLLSRETSACIACSRLEREIEDWRKAHTMQAWAHDRGIRHALELGELELRQAAARAEQVALGPRIEEAKRHEVSVSDEAHRRIRAEQVPVLAKVAELERLHREKARGELQQDVRDREVKQEPEAVRPQTRAELLDEFAKAHEEHDLYFNRDAEREEIRTMPAENVREYLQAALDGRIERQQQASEQDRGFEL